jgi:DNA-binding MarR family transcriptional regulator
MTSGYGRAAVRSEWSAGTVTLPSSDGLNSSALSTAYPVAAGPLDPRSEQVRLALRVVLHLARTGVLETGETVHAESTQQGMAASLNATQGAVSKVLQRLVAAEVVKHDRHHVWGQGRRMRAYSLTARGAELARRYRAQPSDPLQLD